MRYDNFKLAWTAALTEAGLLYQSPAREHLDLDRLCRHYETSVEPLGGQDAAPFYVTAGLSWQWDALQEARTSTTEEDLLIELLGRGGMEDTDTEPPWLRVDVVLRATLPWGRPLPLPSQEMLRKWTREVVGRLERTEPLLPDEFVQETAHGDLAARAWKGEPEVRAACAPDGLLRLERVELASWYALQPPRIWDDPGRWDEGLEEELAAFFARVRRALHVWMECLDHLTRKR